MTLDEFIERLRERAPKFNWRLQYGKIRGSMDGETCCCPITAVDRWAAPAVQWHSASRRLGLEMAEADAIIEAADGTCDHDEVAAKLRRRLLEAVGLAP